jgi:hypothetical protein
MPCYQPSSLPSGVTTTGRTGYKTEADCLQACKEGACCEGTTCTIRPQCQCQGTGQTFKGVGTVCTAGTCCDLFSAGCAGPFLGFAPTTPSKISASISLSVDWAERYPRHASPDGTTLLNYESLSGGGTVPFPTCAYYYQFIEGVPGNGVSFAATFYFVSTSSGVSAAMAFTLGITAQSAFPGSIQPVTAFTSAGPCVSGTFISAAPCYSATAGLYALKPFSSSSPCGSAYEYLGTLSVTG